ncbi:MAG TPA: LamG domain-containing protein [Polyangia bacterium]|nr:LamG domain-containing protein [Polyangia bacterium]
MKLAGVALAIGCTAPNPAYHREVTDTLIPPADAAGDAAGPAEVAQLQSGLLGYWALDDGAGSTTHDGSGQGRDGQVEGLTEGVAFVAGRVGGALSFPGGSSASIGVRIPYSTEIDELRAFTIAAWFRLASVPGFGMQRSVISRQLGRTTGEVFNLTCNNGDVVVYIPGSGGQINFEARAKGAAVLGAWTHGAATYDGRTLRLYVNGREAAASSFADRLVSSVGTPVYIGTNKNTTNSEPFHGLIDEVALYSYALSPAAVAQLAADASPRDVR